MSNPVYHSKYPISLYELNRALEKATTPPELRASFPFLESFASEKDFTFEVFIKGIRRLILTYKDLNQKDLETTKERIISLFKITDKEKKLFEDIQARATLILEFIQKSVNIPSTEPHPALPAFEQLTNTPIKLCEVMGGDSLKTALKNLDLIKEIDSSPEKRLARAYEIGKANTDPEKAKILQIILNLLVVETDLIKQAAIFIPNESRLLAFENQKRASSDRTLLSKNGEITFFEIPESLVETEIFAFWLNLSNYIDLSTDRERLYASMRPLDESLSKANRNERQVLGECLQELLKQVESNNLKLIINLMLETITLDNDKRIYIARKNFYSLVEDLNPETDDPISLFNQEWEQDLVSFTPFFNNLIVSVLGLFCLEEEAGCRIDYKTRCSTKDKIELTIKAWVEKQESQRKLYDIARKELYVLIGKNKKDPQFKEFNTDLTEIYFEQERRPIRNYPKLEEVLPNFKPAKRETSPPKQFIQPVKKPIKSAPKPIKQPAKAKNSTPQRPIKTVNPQPQIETPPPKQSQPIKAGNFTPQQPIKTAEKGKTLVKAVKQIPLKRFPYKWDERVIRWANHPFGKELPGDIFSEYQGCNLNYQKKMHVFHDLHHYVDSFLSLGIRGKWINKTTEFERIVIPAEVTFQAKKQRGFIAYTIDKANVCFHKFFHVKTDQYLIAHSVQRVFDANDFEEKQKVKSTNNTAKPQASPTNESIELQSNLQDTYSVDALTGNVLIEDRKRGITIKLFKT